MRKALVTGITGQRCDIINLCQVKLLCLIKNAYGVARNLEEKVARGFQTIKRRNFVRTDVIQDIILGRSIGIGAEGLRTDQTAILEKVKPTGMCIGLLWRNILGGNSSLLNIFIISTGIPKIILSEI